MDDGNFSSSNSLIRVFYADGGYGMVYRPIIPIVNEVEHDLWTYDFYNTLQVIDKEEVPGKGLIEQKEWLLLFEGSEPFSQVQ